MLCNSSVFVQSNSDKKFIASVVGIPNCSVEGSTKEEAIELARVCLENQLANGDLVTIKVNKAPKQLQADQYFREFRKAGIRIGTEDLRMRPFVLLTRNRQDFEKIPGLSFQDWSI